MTDTSLRPQAIAADTVLTSPGKRRQLTVDINDLASSVMTDFTRLKPISIQAGATIDSANEKMISNSIRLLFVNDANQTLCGLITSTDILGGKPVRYATATGSRRDEITVRDIMTPSSDLEAFSYEAVERATVGDVVEALRQTNRHHMLVIQNDEQAPFIRGIFSLTQLARQLGKDLSPDLRAHGFAELNKALSL